MWPQWGESEARRAESHTHLPIDPPVPLQRVCPGNKTQIRNRLPYTPHGIYPKAEGAWVAQSVKRPATPQVMISWFVGSSPASGSVLTTQSLEPASDSVSPSLSAPPLLKLACARARSLSLSLSKINKHEKF